MKKTNAVFCFVPTGSIGDAQEMVDRLVLHDLDNGQEFRRCHSARSAQEPPPYRLSPSDPRLPSGVLKHFRLFVNEKNTRVHRHCLVNNS